MSLLPESVSEQIFRQKCWHELQAARKAGLLTAGTLHPGELAEHTAAFARFSDPQRVLEGEERVLEAMARQLTQAGYDNLARFVTQQPPQGASLLVIAVRYFFRRAVEEDAKLFQGLAFAQLERLNKEQEDGFASLHAAMIQQGERLEDLLADVKSVVIETHSAVLDLRGQIEGQSGQLQEIGTAVQKLLEQHQLHRREVRPGDSLSIRNDNERQLVKQLVARYRALPEEERRQVPALLNGWAKTCCFAVFQTAQPLPRHWQSIPPARAELLGTCLDEDPKKRPRRFASVIDELNGVSNLFCEGSLAVNPLNLELWAQPSNENPPKQSQTIELSPTVMDAVSVDARNKSVLREATAFNPNQVEQAKSLVKSPAIALVVASFLGIGFNLFMVGFGFIDEFITPLGTTSKERRKAEVLPSQPRAEKTGAAKKSEYASQEDRAAAVMVLMFYSFCAVASGLTLLAGFSMLKLKHYWLSWAGSIAIIPGACFCCLIGIPIGIWSIVVLSKPEVYSAFK